MLWALLILASPPISIRGNIALPEDLYFTVLGMSETSSVTTSSVESALTDFLHGSGYELAIVSANVEDDRIIVDIDEGRLDKIIFVGESSLNAIRLQLADFLPLRIYNRPMLEKKLAELIDDTDVVGAHYEVLPVRHVVHPGIQAPDPKLIPGIAIFRPGEPHELHIHLIHDGFSSGLDAAFGVKAPDGLFVRGDYKHGSLIFDRDLTLISGRLAIRLVDAFTSAGSRLGLSEASVRFKWYTPSFADNLLRSFLSFEALAVGARRTDLGLKSYLTSPLRASLNLQLSVFRYFELGIGFGVEHRLIYGLIDEDDVPRSPIVDATNANQGRLFGRAEARAIFNPYELRRDRLHELSLLVNHFSGGSENGKPFTEVFLHWEKMFEYGWDEIWIGLDGALLLGQVPFYDDVSLGSVFLRGTFTQVYLRNVAAAHFEYRLSLSRDIFKVGIYNDFAIYSDAESLFADAIGLSVHLLVLDAFQLSGFLGVGVNSNKDVDVGFGIEAKQAF